MLLPYVCYIVSHCFLLIRLLSHIFSFSEMVTLREEPILSSARARDARYFAMIEMPTSMMRYRERAELRWGEFERRGGSRERYGARARQLCRLLSCYRWRLAGLLRSWAFCAEPSYINSRFCYAGSLQAQVFCWEIEREMSFSSERGKPFFFFFFFFFWPSARVFSFSFLERERFWEREAFSLESDTGYFPAIYWAEQRVSFRGEERREWWWCFWLYARVRLTSFTSRTRRQDTAYICYAIFIVRIECLSAALCPSRLPLPPARSKVRHLLVSSYFL